MNYVCISMRAKSFLLDNYCTLFRKIPYGLAHISYNRGDYQIKKQVLHNCFLTAYDKWCLRVYSNGDGRVLYRQSFMK